MYMCMKCCNLERPGSLVSPDTQGLCDCYPNSFKATVLSQEGTVLITVQ